MSTQQASGERTFSWPRTFLSFKNIGEAVGVLNLPHYITILDKTCSLPFHLMLEMMAKCFGGNSLLESWLYFWLVKLRHVQKSRVEWTENDRSFWTLPTTHVMRVHPPFFCCLFGSASWLLVPIYHHHQRRKVTLGLSFFNNIKYFYTF